MRDMRAREVCISGFHSHVSVMQTFCNTPAVLLQRNINNKLQIKMKKLDIKRALSEHNMTQADLYQSHRQSDTDG